MTILDSEGDTRISWSRRNPDEVEGARRHFNTLRGKNYLAFRTEGREGRGTQLDEFDPAIENILMVPPSVGG
jgi:hypothetical protein